MPSRAKIRDYVCGPCFRTRASTRRYLASTRRQQMRRLDNQHRYWVGHQYAGYAPSLDEADRMRQYIQQRTETFRAAQRAANPEPSC